MPNGQRMSSGTTRSPRPGMILLVVALVISVRVLGLSALMPVFSPFGLTLTDDVLLVGFAFGGYGLTMALMQIPMGRLSDRIGRKPVMLGGMSMFVAGNLLAWWAPTIEWLIAARLIEGFGAVSSVGLALLTDVAPAERRTFSLAIAGIGAGVSFLLGVSLGPIVASAIGVRGIFLATAGLGALLVLVILAVIPNLPPHPDAERIPLMRVLGTRRGAAIGLAGFTMNLTLTATMFALPLLAMGAPEGSEAAAQVGTDGALGESAYRNFLLLSVLVGGVISTGMARAVDKRGLVHRMSLAAALAIGFGAAGLVLVGSFWLYVVFGLVYFGAHGAQSASLPSLVGGLFPGHHRGAAMGGYNTATFLGSFAGGVLGSLLFGLGPLFPAVLIGMGVLAAAFLVTLPAPADVPKGPSAGPADEDPVQG